MNMFWSKGYDGTSLDDLCDATGLGRSSLYAAFGDKHALLLRSLDRYHHFGIARIAAALARRVPIRRAIGDFIADHIDQIIAGPGRRGCFMGNCAAELARHDKAATERVRTSMIKVEELFRDALRKAQRRGEIATNSDVKAMARFLVAGIQGLRLVGKANPDRALLEDIRSMILRCVK